MPGIALEKFEDLGESFVQGLPLHVQHRRGLRGVACTVQPHGECVHELCAVFHPRAAKVPLAHGYNFAKNIGFLNSLKRVWDSGAWSR